MSWDRKGKLELINWSEEGWVGATGNNIPFNGNKACKDPVVETKRKPIQPPHLKNLLLTVLTICKPPTGLLHVVIYNFTETLIQIVRLCEWP